MLIERKKIGERRIGVDKKRKIMLSKIVEMIEMIEIWMEMIEKKELEIRELEIELEVVLEIVIIKEIVEEKRIMLLKKIRIEWRKKILEVMMEEIMVEKMMV